MLLDADRALSDIVGLRRVPTVLVLDQQRRATAVFEAYPGNPAVLQAVRRAAAPVTAQP